MHVRKFEADSVEEAINDIKQHLGPEAIILKTVTNKGLKGTFKRKKIEITAAISEQKYIAKAKVDSVLTADQKNTFYNDSASSISKSLNRYTKNSGGGAGYGNLALNRPVNKVNTEPSKVEERSDLDDFLNFSSDTPVTEKPEESDYVLDNIYDHFETDDQNVQRTMVSTDDSALLTKLTKRIESLEKMLADRNIDEDSDRDIALRDLRNSLVSFGICKKTIDIIIKKITFEFSDEDIEDEQKIFDFALREMSSSIATEMPLFSRLDISSGPVISLLVSDSSSGQTSMALKLASMNKGSVIIQSGALANEVSDVSVKVVQDIFSIELVKVTEMAEIVSECRKAIDAGKPVIIDYRNMIADEEDTRKFVETLKRSFSNVESLLTLSAIHSEVYNSRAVEKYRVIADGIILTHLDQCLDYGALYNIAVKTKNIPYKFYGTGRNIPDDLEAATPERLIAGIFKL